MSVVQLRTSFRQLAVTDFSESSTELYRIMKENKLLARNMFFFPKLYYPEVMISQIYINCRFYLESSYFCSVSMADIEV
jgi:hypothetical protein